jgi:galactokinase
MDVEKVGDLAARLVSGLRGAYGIHEGQPILFVQAPSFIELAGGYTDHEGGHGIVAAIDNYVSGVFQANGSKIVRISGDGFESMGVFLEDLSTRAAEKGKVVAVVRGLAAQMKSLGAMPVGFDAYLKADGPMDKSQNYLSAFELVCAQAMNVLWTQGAQGPSRLALMAKRSEIEWFGALGGSIGQIACALGGIQYISSAESDSPKIDTIGVDFESTGYEIYRVHVVPDSAESSNEHAVIAEKMRAVADDLGAELLGELSIEDVMSHISALRHDVGDHAVLCALQYFHEESLVKARADALTRSDMEQFCRLTRDSATFSALLLQGGQTCPADAQHKQSLLLGLALGASLLSEQGACRIYDMEDDTIQAFVPKNVYENFMDGMDEAFGAGATCPCAIESEGISCHWL